MQYELLRCVSEDSVWNIHKMFRSAVHRINGVRISSDTATIPITMEREDTKRQGIVRASLSGSVVKFEVSMGRKR